MIFFAISRFPEATEGCLRPTTDSWALQVSHRISLHVANALPAAQGWGQVESQHRGCFLQCRGKHIPRNDPKALFQVFFSVAPPNAHKRLSTSHSLPSFSSPLPAKARIAQQSPKPCAMAELWIHPNTAMITELSKVTLLWRQGAGKRKHTNSYRTRIEQLLAHFSPSAVDNVAPKAC